MQINKLIFVPLLALIFPLSFLLPTRPYANAQTLTTALTPLQTEALQLLSWFEDLITRIYSPKDIKTQLFGWNLNAEIHRSRQAILANSADDVLTFQRIFRNLFKSMHDYHARLTFDRTDVSTLPFRVINIGQQFFISEIDRTKISFTQFPFYVGDEIVSFDGLPITDAISRALEEMRVQTNPRYDVRNAAFRLTASLGANLEAVRKGPVDVEIRPQADPNQGVKKVTLNWNYTRFAPKAELSFPADLLSNDVDFADLTSVTASKNGHLPDFGPVVWENDPTGLFRSYIFKLGKRRIGYIRIPTFVAGANEVSEFARIIGLLENQTDALVLDETNNPGGSTFYFYALTTYLIQKPVQAPLFRQSVFEELAESNQQRLNLIRSIADENLLAKLWPEDLRGLKMNGLLAKDLASYYQDYVDSFVNKIYVLGPQFKQIQTVYPAVNETTYSKPILMLIDEMDASCGDMFPAFLKSIGRATLFGATTAGAVGNNTSGPVPPNSFGIEKWSLTISTMVVDGELLENKGAVPDVSYEPVIKDIRTHYSGYRRAVRHSLQNLFHSP